MRGSAAPWPQVPAARPAGQGSAARAAAWLLSLCSARHLQVVAAQHIHSLATVAKKPSQEAFVFLGRPTFVAAPGHGLRVVKGVIDEHRLRNRKISSMAGCQAEAVGCCAAARRGPDPPRQRRREQRTGAAA